MKKIFTLTLLILGVSLAISQEQGSVVIKWTEKKELSYGNFSYSVPQFNAVNYQFDTYNKTLKFSLQIKLNNLVNENGLQISNPVFESISENQLGDLSTKNIPSELIYSLRNSIARDLYYGLITISPIIKEGNAYKKLVSFSYSIAQNTANRNSILLNNVSTVENSVLSSGNWYRFYVEKSGVYKISKSFLQSLGLETNVDPRKIKISAGAAQDRNARAP